METMTNLHISQYALEQWLYQMVNSKIEVFALYMMEKKQISGYWLSVIKLLMIMYRLPSPRSVLPFKGRKVILIQKRRERRNLTGKEPE